MIPAGVAHCELIKHDIKFRESMRPPRKHSRKVTMERIIIDLTEVYLPSIRRICFVDSEGESPPRLRQGYSFSPKRIRAGRVRRILKPHRDASDYRYSSLLKHKLAWKNVRSRGIRGVDEGVLSVHSSNQIIGYRPISVDLDPVISLESPAGDEKLFIPSLP